MPTIIQTKKGTSVANYVNTLSFAFDQNVVAGDYLSIGIVTSNAGSTSIASVTDTLGNTWVQRKAVSGVTFNTGLYYWDCVNCLGGPTPTITITLTAGEFDTVSAVAREYRNIKTSAQVDVSSSNVEGSYVIAHPTGTTSTTAQANELVVALYACPNAAANFSVGVGYTTPVTQANVGAFSIITYTDKVVSSTGAQSTTINSDVYTQGVALIITIKGTTTTVTDPIPDPPVWVIAPTDSNRAYVSWNSPKTVMSGGFAVNTNITGFTVKRSTTSGSGYVTLATGVTNSFYDDTTVVNGTTYYYVVTATSNGGTSGNSAQATAVVAPLPSPHADRWYAHGTAPTGVSQATIRGYLRAHWDKYVSYTFTQTGAQQAGWGAYRVQAPDQGFAGGPPGGTVSEGIGYAMIAACYMSNRNNPVYDIKAQSYFHGMLLYYQYYVDIAQASYASGVLMNWAINPDGSVQGYNGATDGDLDAAFALFMMHRLYGSTGAVNYWQPAITMTNAIKAYEFLPSTFATPYIIDNGDGWGTGPDLVAPDYIRVGYFGIFQYHTNDAAWATIKTNNWNFIATKFTNVYPAGLVPNACDRSGQATSLYGWGDFNFGYNAIRMGWGYTLDYLWNGTAAAYNNQFKMASTAKTRSGNNPNNVGQVQNLNGGTGGSDQTFASGYGSAATVDPSTADFAGATATFIHSNGVTENSYFGLSQGLTNLLLLSGEFTPDFGAIPPDPGANNALISVSELTKVYDGDNSAKLQADSTLFGTTNFTQYSPTGVTVQMWVNIRSTQATSVLFDIDDISVETMNLMKAGGAYSFSAATTNGFFTSVGVTASTVEDGTWHHLAGTYDGAHLHLFLDGVEQSPGSATAVTGNIITSNPAKPTIGWRQNGTFKMTGNVADVRIYNVTRTAGQIAADMNQRLNGNETGLTAYWPLLLDSNDYTSNANNLTGTFTKANDGPFHGTRVTITTLAFSVADSSTVTDGDILIIAGSNKLFVLDTTPTTETVTVFIPAYLTSVSDSSAVSESVSVAVISASTQNASASDSTTMFDSTTISILGFVPPAVSTTTSVKFDGTEIQTSTFSPQFIQHESAADRNLFTYPVAREDGQVLIAELYGHKVIFVQGMVHGSSRTDLDNKVDQMKELFSRPDRNLDISWSDGTRRYVATCSKHEFKRDYYHINAVPWTAEFTVPAGIGTDMASTSGLAQHTILTAANGADFVYDDVVVFGGSTAPKPVITLEIVNADSAMHGIEYTNTDTGERILITRSTDWSTLTGDQLKIDCDNFKVTDNFSSSNQSEGKFYGTFPRFKIGTNNVRIRTGGFINQSSSDQPSAATTVVSANFYVGLTANNRAAQSFQVPYTEDTFGALTVGMTAVNGAVPIDLIVGLYPDSGGLPNISGTPIANWTIPSTSVPTYNTFAYVTAWSGTPFSLSANTTYWLVFGGGTQGSHYFANYYIPGGYPRGVTAFCNNAGAGNTFTLDGNGGALSFALSIGGKSSPTTLKHTVDYVKRWL